MTDKAMVVASVQHALSGRDFPNLRVAVLAHHCDQPVAIELIELFQRSGILCWTEEQLLPGQDWELEIHKAYRKADFILILLSEASVQSTGMFQKQIKMALDAGSFMPEGGIKTIPIRLDECEVPFILRDLICLDLWRSDAMIRLVLAWAKEWQRRKSNNDWPKADSSAWKW